MKVHILKQMIEEVFKDNDFNFIVVNVDKNEKLSEEYGVQGIPYVVIFLNGEKKVDFSGVNAKKLDEAIELIFLKEIKFLFMKVV